MDIKHDNYEIWAIDYLEGNLTPSETAEFMAFLAENPNLADELDNIRDGQSISSQQEETTDFSFLKKKYENVNINAESFEEFCIAYHEEDLSERDQKKLIEYIGKDATKQKVFETYGNLKLQANESIVFFNKQGVKKKELTQTFWSRRRIIQLSSSIAAAILIFIVLNYNTNNKNNSSNTLTKSDHLTAVKTPGETQQIVAEHPEIAQSSDKAKLEIAEPLSIRETPIQISEQFTTEVVDTSVLEDVFIPAARIDIASIPSNFDDSELNIVFPEFSSPEISNSLPRIAYQNVQHNTQLLLAKAGNLSLDALLRKSVEGLNQVAEADLKYNSETDEDGKIIAFALSSERINIKRKIRNN